MGLQYTKRITDWSFRLLLVFTCLRLPRPFNAEYSLACILLAANSTRYKYVISGWSICSRFNHNTDAVTISKKPQFQTRERTVSRGGKTAWLGKPRQFFPPKISTLKKKLKKILIIFFSAKKCFFIKKNKKKI